MKYRELGKTGVHISEIVYGAGAVGGLLIREPPDVRLEAVRRAIEYGINWFDTAPATGRPVRAEPGHGAEGARRQPPHLNEGRH